MDKNSLTELKATDYGTTDKHTMIDISEINLNTKNDVQTRMQKFISEVKNPYILKCGKTIVEIEFSGIEKTLDFCVKNYLKSLKIG